MRILIVTPAAPQSRQGNRVTANRWARLLRALRHRVAVAETFTGQKCDLLIALHARKSARSIARFRREFPAKPIIVVLTGTDLYADLPKNAAAQRSLVLADRLVVLQSRALERLPSIVRRKTRVIVQSAVPPPHGPRHPHRSPAFLEVCVVGHLRPVKDPFRTALAARRLPPDSQIQVTHLGAALGPAMERRALAERQRNPRYRWLGDRPQSEVLRRLAGSDLLVNSSKMEGGANAICEALACGTPILSSRIDGSIGLLGDNYPGYFDVGDTAALSHLLRRFEASASFRRDLRDHCHQLRSQVDPARETTAWNSLLDELVSLSR